LVAGEREGVESMTERATALPDNRLSFTDQALFLWLQASGEAPVMQEVWIYERPVDLDAVRRFHRNWSRAPIGRLRVERSPLPFGRHRWVLSDGPQPDIEFVEKARPRAELTDWADERVQIPVDPELGPWHLAVCPFTDGSTAVSLVVSHCLGDGLGTLIAVGDVIKGNSADLGYPPAGMRTRRRAMAADARETLRGVPEVARTLGKAAKFAFDQRHDFLQSRAAKRDAGATRYTGDDADSNVVVPAIVVYVDLDQWDARAKALGGNGHSLVAGMAAVLGERMGRHRADGKVTLLIPTSNRTENDTRRNAEILASVPVDPTQVTKDLSDAKAAIRQGLKSVHEVPDQPLELLPLIPFVPRRAVQQGGDAIFGFAADLPVSSSNLGDLESAIGSVDGTEADYVILRGVDGQIARRALEDRRGLLTLVGGRICGKMSISIIAYEPGGAYSKAHLRELASATLADFGLTGVVD
jgi:hypothetical protein